jgi:hypothetical protein
MVTVLNSKSGQIERGWGAQIPLNVTSISFETTPTFVSITPYISVWFEIPHLSKQIPSSIYGSESFLRSRVEY